MREIDGKYPLKDSLNAVYSTYPMYDKIVSVSEQCLEANKKDFPSYESKMVLVHNFIVQPCDLLTKLNFKYANFESICDNLSIALEVQPHSDNQ